jgi:hypothetical protein
MENGRYHINEGQVVVDDGESEEERREAELRALQLKLSREEAGEQRRSRWPEAS